MRFLLDTHVLIRWCQGERRLPASHRRAIRRGSAQNPLLVSDISLWEIAMLQNKGRLALTMDVREWTRSALERADFDLLQIDMDVAIESCRLAMGIGVGMIKSG